MMCVEYNTKAIIYFLKNTGVQWIKLSRAFTNSCHSLRNKFGAVCIQPLRERIRVIQLRSDHAWVIVTIAYLERRDDSCSAGGDKKPSSRLITNILRV